MCYYHYLYISTIITTSYYYYYYYYYCCYYYYYYCYYYLLLLIVLLYPDLAPGIERVVGLGVPGHVDHLLNIFEYLNGEIVKKYVITY